MPAILGPLKPVVGYVVQLATRWIVREYQNSLATNVRKLYERREANSIWGSDDHVLLRRPGSTRSRSSRAFARTPSGVPGFLLGGAVLSGLFSVIGKALSSAVENGTGRICVLGAFGALLVGCHGSPCTRRRSPGVGSA